MKSKREQQIKTLSYLRMRRFGFESGAFLSYGGGRRSGLRVVGGRRRRGSGLDGLEHALADLFGVDLEDLDAVVFVGIDGFGGGGGIGGGGEGLLLDEAGSGGGVFDGDGAVALGESGGCGEGLDHALDDCISRALRGRPDAQRCAHARLLLFLSLTDIIKVLIVNFFFFCHCCNAARREMDGCVCGLLGSFPLFPFAYLAICLDGCVGLFFLRVITIYYCLVGGGCFKKMEWNG